MIKFNYGRYFDRKIMKNIIINIKDDRNKKMIKKSHNFGESVFCKFRSCYVTFVTFKELTEMTKNTNEINFKELKCNIFLLRD